jgi:hypothetical protein
MTTDNLAQSADFHGERGARAASRKRVPMAIVSEHLHPSDEDSASQSLFEHLAEDSALPSVLALSALSIVVLLSMMGCSGENRVRRAYFDSRDAELTAQPVLMSESMESSARRHE